MNNADKENELALLMRARYGDNAVEALVGALSSVTTPEQLDALIQSLKLPTNQEWSEVIR
jgi:hypothetical protein